MKTRLPSLPLGLMLTALLLTTGCTWRTEHRVETVHRIDAHIVLDIRQIKEEATQIEDYVREDSSTIGVMEPTTMTAVIPASFDRTYAELVRLEQAGRRGGFALVSAACAQAPQPAQAERPAPVTSEQERRAVEARKARLRAVNEALDQGHIGENNKGLLTVLLPRDSEQRELLARMQQLVREENADRTIIYRALAQRQPEGARSVDLVGMAYASVIREQMKRGQTFQVPTDERFLEEFRQSEVGKAHADAKPGSWVKKAIDPPKREN